MLADHKAEWQAAYETAKAAGEDVTRIVENYRNPEIKAALVEETSDKCAYCESNIKHADNLEVEHIRPRSKHEDLIFAWKNLTLACHQCNASKNAYYDEDIGILNPYEVDPKDHLQAAGPLVLPKPGDDIGEIAWRLFDLDRPSLIEKRRQRLMVIQNLVDARARRKNGLAQTLIDRDIRKELADDQEYTLVTRTFVK